MGIQLSHLQAITLLGRSRQQSQHRWGCSLLRLQSLLKMVVSGCCCLRVQGSASGKPAACMPLCICLQHARPVCTCMLSSCPTRLPSWTLDDDDKASSRHPCELTLGCVLQPLDAHHLLPGRRRQLRDGHLRAPAAAAASHPCRARSRAGQSLTRAHEGPGCLRVQLICCHDSLAAPAQLGPMFCTAAG